MLWWKFLRLTVNTLVVSSFMLLALILDALVGLPWEVSFLASGAAAAVSWTCMIGLQFHLEKICALQRYRVYLIKDQACQLCSGLWIILSARRAKGLGFTKCNAQLKGYVCPSSHAGAPELQ